MIASIDVGIKNFAFCIEDKGKIILLQKHEVYVPTPQQLAESFIDVLDAYLSFWEECHVILIEKQMSTNLKAVKVEQICQTYFLIKTKAKIILFPSTKKTQLLNAPKHMNKKARKEWAVDIALFTLSQREDYDSMETILDEKKKDDLSDVILQLEAYKTDF